MGKKKDARQWLQRIADEKEKCKQCEIYLLNHETIGCKTQKLTWEKDTLFLDLFPFISKNLQTTECPHFIPHSGGDGNIFLYERSIPCSMYDIQILGPKQEKKGQGEVDA